MNSTPQPEVDRLRNRVSRLAGDKSRLQLIIRMMSRIGAAPGPGGTPQTMVTSLADILGGTNVALYYLVGGEIRYRDVYGTYQAPAVVDDELVRRAFRTQQTISEVREFSETRMVSAEFTKAHTWAYPLQIDGNLVGVLKLENLFFDMRELEPELSLFLSHLALTLKNAIANEHRLQTAYADLEDVNRELEAFAYSVSHDLKAPLRAIDGYSEILLEDYGDRFDETGRQHLDRIRSNTATMASLLDAMLRMSRQTRGEMILERVDLSEFVREIADQLRLGEPGRNVEFVIAPRVEATADPCLIRTTMENLLGNAWKFTGHHPHARIEFGVTRRGDEQIYFVRDDGAGFDMEMAGKLFTPFRRLHRPGEFRGTGIGLATVQRLVRRHGGRIWAEGRVEGGATFSFTLGERPTASLG